MEKEEVELLPSGLVSCLLDDREVRILKISPEKLTVRIADEIEKIKDDFSLAYVFCIKNQEYLYNVRNIFKNYSNYITLKAFGDENEFSKEMVGYPAELDYEFYKYYLEQKKDWMSGLSYSGWNENSMDSLELAITLDNYYLYRKYMNNHIKVFKEKYLKENFIDNHKLFQKDIKRIYIGNEFCHNLFPEVELLMNMIQKAQEEGIEITLCFTYMRDEYMEKTKGVLHKVYSWCRKNNRSIEIIVNDFRMLKLVEDKTDYFKLSLGLLLNKRKKDPRYTYKKGFMENKKLVGENILNSSIFNRFLKECKIERYEYENCGYRISIAEGCHSMHIPFYQTNTSQYCPLYAMCTTMDRGNQKLVVNCPKYCGDYVFSYPKHLKMVGRGNSIENMEKDVHNLKKAICILDDFGDSETYEKEVKNKLFNGRCSGQCYYQI